MSLIDATIDKIKALRQSIAGELMQAQRAISLQADLIRSLQNEVDALNEENTNLLAQLQEFRGRGISIAHLRRRDG